MLTEPIAKTVANFPLLANNKYYTSRNKPVLGIVLHVTAGLQDLGMVGNDPSAEGTIKFGQNTTGDASWHAIADTDTAKTCLPSTYTAWQVKGYNSPTVGIEISNLDAKWDNKPAKWVEATLRNAAQLAAMYVKKYDLPLTLSKKAAVDTALSAGKKFGFSYHMWLNPATRSDPGVTFPWSQFIGYVKEYLTGTGEIDMAGLEEVPHDVWAYKYKDRQALAYLVSIENTSKATLTLLQAQQALITGLLEKGPGQVDVEALTARFESVLDNLSVTLNTDTNPSA